MTSVAAHPTMSDPVVMTKRPIALHGRARIIMQARSGAATSPFSAALK